MDALIGYAVELSSHDADLAYLEHSGLTPEQVQKRLRELRALPSLPNVAEKIDLGERLFQLDLLRTTRLGNLHKSIWIEEMEIPEKLKPKVKAALGKIDWEPTLRDQNRWFDRLGTAAKITDRAARTRELNTMKNELEKINQTNKKSGTLIGLLTGGDEPNQKAGKVFGESLVESLPDHTAQLLDAHDRVVQTQQNLEIAFALAAYRGVNGRYPEKLNDLAPKYLSSVPRDLFSGKPLIYRPSVKGYLFYSVGPNGRDDDGQFFREGPKGDDVGVRMPLPELKLK